MNEVDLTTLERLNHPQFLRLFITLQSKHANNNNNNKNANVCIILLSFYPFKAECSSHFPTWGVTDVALTPLFHKLL